MKSYLRIMNQSSSFQNRLHVGRLTQTLKAPATGCPHTSPHLRPKWLPFQPQWSPYLNQLWYQQRPSYLPPSSNASIKLAPSQTGNVQMCSWWDWILVLVEDEQSDDVNIKYN